MRSRWQGALTFASAFVHFRWIMLLRGNPVTRPGPSVNADRLNSTKLCLCPANRNLDPVTVVVSLKCR